MGLFTSVREYVRGYKKHNKSPRMYDAPEPYYIKQWVREYVSSFSSSRRRTYKAAMKRIRKILNNADAKHTYSCCGRDECSVPVHGNKLTDYRGRPTGGMGYCVTCRNDYLVFDQHTRMYIRDEDSVSFYSSMNNYLERYSEPRHRDDVVQFRVPNMDPPIYVAGWRPDGASTSLNGYHGTQRNQKFVSDEWSKHMAKMDTSIPPIPRAVDAGLGVEIEGYAAKGKGAQHFIDKVVAAPGFSEMIRGFETDSSLIEWPDDAFEMVTQAASLPRLRKYFIEEFPRNTGGKSHNTTTAGLHVHVTRSIMSTAHQLRLVRFMGSPAMQQFLTDVARRPPSGYCNRPRLGMERAKNPEYGSQYASTNGPARIFRTPPRYADPVMRTGLVPATLIPEMSRDPKFATGQDHGAVDFSHQKTVEFRLFRGTLKPETIVATLEFVWHVVLFTRHASNHKFEGYTPAQFIEFINKPEHASETRYLRGYLKSLRHQGVRVPKPMPEGIIMKKPEAALVPLFATEQSVEA